jgi:hypothetical protein
LDRSAAVAVLAETTAAPTNSLESSFFTEAILQTQSCD